METVLPSDESMCVMTKPTTIDSDTTERATPAGTPVLLILAVYHRNLERDL
jgi:hypothetical protein